MKLATLKNGSVIIVSKNGTIPLSELGFPGSILEFIKAGESEWNKIEDSLQEIKKDIILSHKTLDAPLKNPSKIVAIGLNYFDHAKESNMEIPKSPLVFTKFNNSITGPTDPIIIPSRITKEVDYEAELGVIIGRTAKNIRKENALEYAFGYTIINDVSARDIQFSDKQWVRAKSLDTFCPMGPVIVTKNEIPDPQNLELGCSVNGIILQQDNTKNMIFSVAELISQLSYSFTFEPGDIIATGTPSGVGFSRTPPVFLKAGDVVYTWIKGIGELINPVINS
ncbi:MAG: fumarylacetoacetate hydrolase family protein [Ignavibacteriaceae bacterium]|jgi:2-keto-4-pentenoate hydratase/2-oxohepta-3-ene-1,7-dioic acid hydratase in catechol pathway